MLKEPETRTSTHGLQVWRLLRQSIVPGCLFSIATAVSGSPAEIKFAASTPYRDQQVTLRANLYKPEGDGPYPAVVLMHGCDGWKQSVRDGLRTHAEYLVRHGFVAFNLDSFGPRKNGGGWVCETFDRLMAARRYRRADALDALKFLQSLDFVEGDNIFQMGQSNGGSVSIRLAQLDSPAFRATAAYYPWCGTFNRLGSKAKLTSPLIVLAGTDDDWTPPADCRTVRATGAEYKVITYPGAVHSFDLNISRQEYRGHTLGYDQTATVDSRKQMVAFFSSHLTGKLKASMPILALDETPAVRYLTGAEIVQLMPSGKLVGINGYGNPYTISYAPDGAMSGVAGKSDEYKDTGKWWVSGSAFCRQYSSWLDGESACFKVGLEDDNISFFDSAGNLVSSGTFGR